MSFESDDPSSGDRNHRKIRCEAFLINKQLWSPSCHNYCFGYVLGPKDSGLASFDAQETTNSTNQRGALGLEYRSVPSTSIGYPLVFHASLGISRLFVQIERSISGDLEYKTGSVTLCTQIWWQESKIPFSFFRLWQKLYRCIAMENHNFKKTESSNYMDLRGPLSSICSFAELQKGIPKNSRDVNFCHELLCCILWHVSN